MLGTKYGKVLGVKAAIYIILKWTNLHNDYFYFWYFNYILIIILFLRLLNLHFECRTFTCNRLFLHSSTSNFTQVQDLPPRVLLPPLPTAWGEDCLDGPGVELISLHVALECISKCE